MPASQRIAAFATVVLSIVFHTSSLAAEPTPNWVFVSLLKSKEILAYQQDPQTGRLRQSARTACPAEPAIMCARTRKGKTRLYVSMRSSGQLAAFEMQERGQLELLGLVPGGDDPAYLELDASGKFLISAYYVAGKVQLNAIAGNGQIVTPAIQSIATAEKAHGVAFTPDNRHVYISHTGPDRIYGFQFNATTGLSTLQSQPFCQTPSGLHPRHALVSSNGRWLLANDEAADSLSVYSIARSGKLEWNRASRTIPEDFDGGRNSTARFQGCPGTDFYYVANRGHDSIAGFRFDQRNGTLTPLGTTPTETTPRSFTISADGQHMYVAGEGSGKVAAYRIGGKGQLTLIETYQPASQQQGQVVPWAILAVDPSDQHAGN